MPTDLPDYDEIIERDQTDIKQSLPDLDPTIFESLILGIIEATGGRHYDLVLSIQQLEKELFPDTATKENLARWAKYDGIIPFTSEQSSGSSLFSGDVGDVIPSGRVFKDASGFTYTSQVSVEIASSTIGVISATRSGSTVTVKTSSNHNLASNIIVVIAGAVETDYNGSFPVSVISLDEFSYEIVGTPSSPATGTITVTCICAVVPVNSDETGITKNLDSGATLTFVSTPPGNVNTDGYVDFLGLTGGRDAETKESLLRRTEQKRANPVSNFNDGAIGEKVLAISGVTRFKIKRLIPGIGQVTILFVKDGKDNIIPTSAEVEEVKNSILTILPVTTEESDVIVTAPTPVETNYSFSSINPNTPTMQDAIRKSLAAMYEDDVTFETNISEDQYRASIIDTIDTETGIKLISFILSSPAGDISVGTDSIGIFGTASF